MEGEKRLADEAATATLGAALGRALAAGDAVLLSGALGAGKTALARAAILARLEDAGRPAEAVPSPTFTLVQAYEADIPIRHVDLYRLADVSEIAELGLEEGFDAAATLIEWPERLGPLLPQRRLEIALSAPAEGGRLLAWRAVGPGWGRAAAALGAAR